MKNNSKQLIIIFFISTFLTLILYMIFLYVSDPLQLFHQRSHQKGLSSNARHQVVGIINNYDFDSVIMGTSMLENTSANESSRLLGGKFVNISINGSDFHTRSIILDYLLKKKKIKKILFSLDNMGLVDLGISDTSNFDFLYDDNMLNDIKVYISPKYFICSIYNKYCLNNLDKDRPFAWYNKKAIQKKFGGLDNWFKDENSNKVKLFYKNILKNIQQINLGKINIEEEKKNLKESQEYIDSTLLTHVRNYPNTQFILILPPYSRVKYALDAQYNVSAFKRYRENIAYLVAKSKLYSNLKIYGWGNFSFIDEIKNYKDLVHYEYKINTWMLSAIKRKEGLLTTDNIDNYLNVFTQKSLKYDLSRLANQINKYLEK